MQMNINELCDENSLILTRTSKGIGMTMYRYETSDFSSDPAFIGIWIEIIDGVSPDQKLITRTIRIRDKTGHKLLDLLNYLGPIYAVKRHHGSRSQIPYPVHEDKT